MDFGENEKEKAVKNSYKGCSGGGDGVVGKIGCLLEIQSYSYNDNIIILRYHILKWYT